MDLHIILATQVNSLGLKLVVPRLVFAIESFNLCPKKGLKHVVSRPPLVIHWSCVVSTPSSFNCDQSAGCLKPQFTSALDFPRRRFVVEISVAATSLHRIYNYIHVKWRNTNYKTNLVVQQLRDKRKKAENRCPHQLMPLATLASGERPAGPRNLPFKLLNNSMFQAACRTTFFNTRQSFLQ